MPTDRSSSPLLPGFDFLKNLASQAGKGLEGLQQLNTMGQSLGSSMAGGMGAGLGGLGGMNGFKQWVAPTLDPDELEKRIEELRTVQFWLEQNARLLGATIQALEVQKMTLSTLRSMDVKLPDLQQVLGAMMPQSTADKTGAEQAPRRAPTEADPGARPSERPAAARKARKPASPSSPGPAASTGGTGSQVDPMRWWGALTEQFQHLATQALATTTASAAAAGAGAKTAPKNSGSHGPSAEVKARAPASPSRPPAKRAGTRSGSKPSANRQGRA